MPSASSYLWLKTIHGLSVFEIVTWYVNEIVGGILVVFGIKDNIIRLASLGLNDDVFPPIIIFIFLLG